MTNKLKYLNRKFIDRNGILLVLKKESRVGYTYSYLAHRLDDNRAWHNMPENVENDYLFRCWLTKLHSLFYE